MIPYIEWLTFSFGPLTIQVWGFFVAWGFLFGIVLARFRYRIIVEYKKSDTNQDIDWIWDLGAWILIGSLIGARLGHVFFYAWPYFSNHLSEIIHIWDGGMASYGGFIGSIVAFWALYKIHKIDLWHTIDALLWAFPFGMIIGRIGCTLIHDHPGKLTSSIFGVQYAGGARFDLGLLEILALLPLTIVFFAWRNRNFKEPVITVVALIYYGIIRFFLDFLRATDIPMADSRYAGLTPAQYGSIVLVFIAIALIKKKVLKSGRVA